MITEQDIQWGRYSAWSGPFWPGAVKFRVSDPPLDEEVLLAIVSATEGSAYDAVNMYDSMLVSLGVIQAVEAKWHLASRLLGHIADADTGLLAPMRDVLLASGATFQKNRKGLWRFFLGDEEAMTVQQQRQLFFGGADGTTRGWKDETKRHARQWAASFANVLGQPGAKGPQLEYVTGPYGIQGCVVPKARQMLWRETEGAPAGLVKAVQALYLSFAGNRGDLAFKALVQTPGDRWSEGWLVALVKRLVHASGIAIYPRRYAVIRPLIKRYYGVELPPA